MCGPDSSSTNTHSIFSIIRTTIITQSLNASDKQPQATKNLKLTIPYPLFQGLYPIILASDRSHEPELQMSLFQASSGFYFLSSKSVAYLIISEASQLVEIVFKIKKTHTWSHW